jgi:SAM-dependent methyltransferase
MSSQSTLPPPKFDLDSAALAKTYEEVSADRQFVTGQQLVATLGLRHGEHVLDVGCGTGLLAEHIAELVGPTGMVFGVDPLHERIQIARRRSREWLAFDVGDAADLSMLTPDSFDVVVLNAVFHWLPDKPRALAQFHKVLKKAGRIGLTTRPPGERTLLQEVRMEVLGEPPFDAHPRAADRSLFRVDGEEMRALLKDAGFRDIEIDLTPSEQSFSDAETSIRFSEASSFGNFLGFLPAELRSLARERIRERLDQRRGGKPIVRRSERLVARARKK